MVRMPIVETEAAFIDKLAALEHDQWIAWSKDVASKEDLSPLRIRRWKALWIPYELLPEKYKEMDRKWARKVLEVIYQK